MCNPNWQTICLSGRSSDNEEQGLTREMMKGPKPALITFPTFLVTIPGQRLDVSPADPDSYYRPVDPDPCHKSFGSGSLP